MSIEKKYTEEEMKAIVAEEIRKMNLGMNRELSADELESVSGGDSSPRYIVPDTHEEIDRLWDLVDATLNEHGLDVAFTMAESLHLIHGKEDIMRDYHTDRLRRYMHDRLDGKVTGLESYLRH